jgi:hypothetical protein
MLGFVRQNLAELAVTEHTQYILKKWEKLHGGRVRFVAHNFEVRVLF